MVADAVRGLPRATTSYVGRQREAAEVRSSLRAGRLVTLTGPGGVGKTRLAITVAGEVAGQFADGVTFVGLAELRDGALVPNLVANRLELQDLSGQSRTRIVLDFLRDRTALLVLDNCEHLMIACAAFAHAVLTECPGMALLTTSRQSLGVPGEMVLRVPSLSVPAEDISPDELVGYDSVRLLLDRATAAEPTFEITPENGAAIAQVCRRLDGLPLALELVAARVRSLSPQQIADRLATHLPVLGTAPRTAPERQQTLRSSIDWSYGLCSPAEQAVWRRASVFAGSFDLDAAEQVCVGPEVGPDEMLDTIDGLLDKSVLLRIEPGDVVRYQMLETLREYGQERLEEADDRLRVERLHRDWIDRLTATADAEWASARQRSWMARLHWENANMRAAIDWSLTQPGEAGAVLRIATRLDEYWALVGSSIEAEEWLSRALAMTPSDHPDRPGALATAGLYALWLGDTGKGLARLDEAEELPAGQDELVRAFRTYVRSLAAMFMADFRTAFLAAEAAAVFRKHGEPRRELHPLFIYSISVIYSAGDLEGARQALQRMFMLSESCGETYYRAMALFGIAVVEVEFGDTEAGESAARECLVLTREIGNVAGFAYHLEPLAWAADRRGDHDRAATILGAAARVWDEVGLTPETIMGIPHKKHMRSALQALGPERFAAAFATGRAMTGEQALQYAVQVRESASPAREELTRREWEIAELVTQGMSNREIAAKLIISLRTADTHVQNILIKLGFRSRAQIAAWVTSRR